MTAVMINIKINFYTKNIFSVKSFRIVVSSQQALQGNFI